MFENLFPIRTAALVRLICAGFAIVSAEVTHAAAPGIDILFPAGGSQGASVKVEASGTGETWPIQVWCSRPELQWKALETKGSLEVTIPADCPPGTAWVRLYNAEGASALRPFIIGTLPELVEAEPNNEPSAAQELSASQMVVHGRHQVTEDVDVYAVQLKTGQTLVMDLDAHRTLGSPADAVLQFLSPEGFVLAQNDDDQGLDPRLVYTVNADGKYYVRTFAFPASPDSGINFAGGPKWLYRLTITTGKFTDFVLPITPFRGIAQEGLAVGWNLGDGPAQFTFPAAELERIQVDVPGSGNRFATWTQTYPQIVETASADPAQRQAMAVPSGMSGVIQAPSEFDIYRFSAKKGTALQFKVLARSLGSQLDPVVTISNLEGKELQRIDDQGENRDPTFNWNPPADGDYLVSVTDLYGHGSGRYFYHLEIAPPVQDFGINAAADSFVLPNDKPLEIALTIDRQAGFAPEIDVTVVGLPAGVTASAAKSLAEGDSAKTVKLTLTGNPAAFSGPIEILATAPGDPLMVRKTKFRLTDFQSETDQLWLTVLPPAPK